jgi:acetylglutamate kinase
MMRVIKVGGRVQRDARLASVLAELWADAPGSFCVVHGGGETITRMQAERGGEARFVDGRRVTTDADIEVLRMALSGVANKQLVSSLSAKGIAAVGISGEDASLLVAEAIDEEVFGRVGAPVDVRHALLLTLLAAGYLPVISPVACDGESQLGAALNVNADDAASAIAAALEAEELLLISDVPGVLIDGTTAATMSGDEALLAVESDIATDGMALKLRAALDALARGVPRVRIGGLDTLTDESRGTTLVATPQLA